MPTASSLILLPPRHTARDPIQSANQPAKRASDDSFDQKLESAKKQKHVAKAQPKIPESPVAQKSVQVKSVATKPTNDPKPEKSPATDKPVSQDLKSEPQDATEVEAKANTEQKPADLPAANAANAGDAANELASAKKIKSAKPARIDKQSGTTKAPPTPDVQQQKTVTPIKAARDSTSKPDSSRSGPSSIAATGGSDSDTDAVDATPGLEPANAEFGTGKVAADASSGKGASKAASNPKNSTDSTSGNVETTSANSSAAAVAASVSSPTISTETSLKASASVGPTIDAVGKLNGADIAGATAALPGRSPQAGGVKSSAAPATPQARFVEENQPKIISSVHGQLMPHGGTMQIRLDPPELGALQVTVHLHEGVMTATFETSNENATRLLSHSLGQLKAGLEAAGVNVEKLHVQQAPKQDSGNSSDSDSKNQPQEQQQEASRDQQRREMVQRLWRKLAGDPLDLVA